MGMDRFWAELGDADAQFNLGVMYAEGRDVPQDYAQAVSWYRRAALQEHAIAQFNLATMYTFGRGVPQDYAQAVSWYRRAAEQGLAAAQFNLGTMHLNGWGVPQDYVQAMSRFRPLAEQGHAGAQYNLGVMYAAGQNVPQNRITAHMWLNLAGMQGYRDARDLRDGIAESMTREQLAEAQQRASHWRAVESDEAQHRWPPGFTSESRAVGKDILIDLARKSDSE